MRANKRVWNFNPFHQLDGPLAAHPTNKKLRFQWLTSYTHQTLPLPFHFTKSETHHPSTASVVSVANLANA